MKRRFIILPVVLAVAASAAFAVWKLWPAQGPAVISGYVEGEPLYLSAATSGLVTRLDVERGDHVAAGAALFQIDPNTAQAQTAEAAANAAAAEAAARDAAKGQRPAELAVIQAERQSARATLDKAQVDFSRTQTLVREGIYAQSVLDQARASLGVAQAAFDQASRQLDVAELGARSDQQVAAQARSQQAREQVT